jgi:hypothetical protein
MAWCLIKRQDKLNFILIYFRAQIHANFMETEYKIWFYQDYKVIHVIDEHCIGIASRVSSSKFTNYQSPH